jgi:oligoribonuclease (3'-5' exoribonuclease)
MEKIMAFDKFLSIQYEHRVFENDLYYKSNADFLKYIDSLKSKTFIWLDTETTGLGGPKQQQLVQVSAIASKSNGKKLDTFNEKIDLNKKSKKRLKTEPKEAEPGKRFSIHQALKLNHYYDDVDTMEYKNEEIVLDKFFKWISSYKNIILIIQNASFDMNMLAGRSGKHNLNYKAFDTMKMVMLYLIPTLEITMETDKDLAKKFSRFPRSRSGSLSSSLHPWGKFFRKGSIKSHDSLEDVKTMMKIYFGTLEFIKKYENADTKTLQHNKIKWIKKVGM